jgi:hypothetical protein
VSESPDIDWGAYVKTELFVFDFDQTITHKHIFPTDIEHLDPEEIKKSFADLDFFRKVLFLSMVLSRSALITDPALRQNQQPLPLKPPKYSCNSSLFQCSE